MKKIFLFLIGISGLLYCQGVNFDWAGSMGQVTQDEGVSIVVDQNGDVITVGYFSGTVDFDPSISVSNLSATTAVATFITKFDSDGNFIWAKKFDHTGPNSLCKATDLAIDVNGNLLITGIFEISIDFDPGAAVSILSSSGANDVFVCKLDNNGNYLWSAKIGGSGNDVSSGIWFDSLDNICISGSYEGMVDFDPTASSYILNAGILGGYRAGYVCKLSSMGGFLWASDFVGPDECLATDLAVDSYNNVVVVGTFTNSVDFDPSISTFNIISNGDYDFFIVQLNSSGQLNYAYGMGGTGWEYDPCKIVAGQAGSVYLTADLIQQIDFDPGPGVLLSTGFSGMFMLKLNVAGQLQWVDEFPAVFGTQVSSNAIGYGINDGVYLTGNFAGNTVDFDPSLTQTFNMSQSGIYTSIFTMKVDTMGDFMWAKSYGGANSASSTALYANNMGDVYTTGYFSDTIDVDPSSDNFDIFSNGQNDIYVQKLKQCLNTMDTIEVSSCYQYISPSGNYTWYSSGTYSDILPNNEGCDSIITIDLSIGINQYSYQNFNLCEGESYLSPSGNYSWNANGTYYDTIPTVSGCDSVITFTLSFYNIDLNVTAGLNQMTSQDAIGGWQWIDCDNGDSIIPFATNSIFYPTTNGNYAVIIDNNICIDTSACVPFVFLNIDEAPTMNLQAFPNPTSNYIGFNTDPSIPQRIIIMNLSGQIIRTDENVNTVNIENLANGSYLICLEYKNDRTYHSIIKN